MWLACTPVRLQLFVMQHCCGHRKPIYLHEEHKGHFMIPQWWIRVITHLSKPTEWQPAPVFLPGKSHGQRSLAGYIQSMGSQNSRTWHRNETTQCLTARVNPKVNYGVSLTMMYQCDFISYSKRNSGGGCWQQGQEDVPRESRGYVGNLCSFPSILLWTENYSLKNRVLLCVCVFATPHSMWNLSSPTRDQTLAPCSGSMKS